MAKSRYEVNKASWNRYMDKMADIKIRVPKGERDIWKVYAAQKGKSLNAFITDLVHSDMDKAGFDYTLPKEDET
ncbi:hypothetical protein [Butyricicoccus intestinisimiae]|jgi:predicted HicB family RNase H-like nuclease|uniref:hypothetical protein n=1 Tax=Butyricicoccus intestinisimiae TaxID=2841509 RepID=UPI003D923CF2